jgi:hypothetical protein
LHVKGGDGDQGTPSIMRKDAKEGKIRKGDKLR